MKRFEVIEYVAAGCSQMERDPGFAGGLVIHNLTDGRMCDGCHAFRQGQCPSYRKLMQGGKSVPTPTETVREEAARLGISIGEVRRRRRESHG